MKPSTVIRSKAGFTLAELVIVMALTGIMTSMVISFTVIVSGWSSTGINRYELVSAERLAANALRMFVSSYDSIDYTFSVDADGALRAERIEDATEYHTFQLEDNVLRYQMPDGVNAEIALDHIFAMRILVVSNMRGRQLISMRLNFSLPQTTGSQSASGEYTVLVCTRSTQPTGGEA